MQWMRLAGHGKAEFGKSGTLTIERPARKRAFVMQIRQSPKRVSKKTISLNRTERLRNTLANILAPVKCNNAPPPRNKVDQAFECRLYGRKTGIDNPVI